MTDTPILHMIESGEGPAVVLLHGLFGAATNLGVVQRHLQSRYRVIAMDLRNHGASPHVAGMGYDQMADDVLRTLDTVGVGAFAVIGHSMGGKVAMRLALTEPARVESLAVLDIAPIRYRQTFRAYADAMQALPLTGALSRREADAILAAAVEDAPVRSFLLQNLRFGEQPGWRIGLKNIADGLPDIEDWVSPDGACYSKPTMFIAGAKSHYVPTPLPAVMTDLFPKSAVARVADAGHWLHAENPAGVLAAIDRFYGAI